MEIAPDEHVITCNLCSRGLIVKNAVNDGIAFLSHLKDDHHIRYTVQQMESVRTKSRNDPSNPATRQMLESQEKHASQGDNTP